MMLSCKQASQLISQSLERRLNWREGLALRMHLMICKYCLRFSQQLRTLRVALSTMCANVENDISITLPSESKARIAQKIDSTR